MPGLGLAGASGVHLSFARPRRAIAAASESTTRRTRACEMNGVHDAAMALKRVQSAADAFTKNTYANREATPVERAWRWSCCARRTVAR